MVPHTAHQEGQDGKGTRTRAGFETLKRVMDLG